MRLHRNSFMNPACPALSITAGAAPAQTISTHLGVLASMPFRRDCAARLVGVISILLGAAASSAHAQWTVTNLHPAGATYSVAADGFGAKQAGTIEITGSAHAVLWNGTAASMVDLHPAGATSSGAYGISGSWQAGYVVFGLDAHAAVWSGTSASFVDLNPVGTSMTSRAYATTSTQQVGSTFSDSTGRDHASLWSSTPASQVDLHPPGAIDSKATNMSNTQQVGWVSFNTVTIHASLWTGSSASWVDLNPPGAQGSMALGAGGNQQVGQADFDLFARAALWTGSAVSFVDLTPPGITDAVAFATSGYLQVGIVYVGGKWRASLWSGTADSWVDLSLALPGSWGETQATSIWSDCLDTYVAGWGYNNATGRREALLWKRSVGFTLALLHPAGAIQSNAYGAGGTQQMGSAQLGWTVGTNRASLWTGTAASWVNLHPASAVYSLGYATDGSTQVGEVYPAGAAHAALWQGTAASWVDLHPATASSSTALGVGGGQQAGWAIVGGVHRACLWSGTAASLVNLNPAGNHSSEAYAVDVGQQVGEVVNNSITSASLWTGSAASWVNLHPPGPYSSSWAYGVGGGQQVGVVRDSVSGWLYAALWTGSAGSFVNLAPAGSFSSRATDASDGVQVGYASIAGSIHACVWCGTAASLMDLNPANFSSSRAESISVDAAGTRIAGHGFNNLTGREEALVWSRSNCSSPGFTIQPKSTSACATGAANFAVIAGGTGPLTYQWQIENLSTVPPTFINLDDGPIVLGGVLIGTSSGATTPGCHIALAPTAGATNRVRCIVTNSCGSVTSNSATFTIITTGDGNADGLTNGLDIQGIAVAVTSDAPTSAGHCAYDMNHDGFVNAADIPIFVNALLSN